MPWTKADALARIRAVGLVPVIRTATVDEALCAAQATVSAGVGIVEITMNTPDAAAVIERVATRHGADVLLGAGTVLDADACRAAIAAGAEFIVTPALDLGVLEVARHARKVCIPGALTPTEVLTAHRAGADIVKIFPCGPVGGPKYIRALRGPFPDIEFLPTGGISLDAIPAFIRAGAIAVGLGSELFDAQALREGNIETTRSRARIILASIQDARAPH